MKKIIIAAFKQNEALDNSMSPYERPVLDNLKLNSNSSITKVLTLPV